MGREWEAKAACAGMPASAFFEDPLPEDPETGVQGIEPEALAKAVSVCSSCPVRVQCYTAAMDEESGAAQSRRWGIRGGLTPMQRYSIWRRDSSCCDRCGEVYDPLGLVAGEAVCSCGEETEPPIPAEGDVWYPRHDGLLRRLTEYLLAETKPGDRILPPYKMLKRLGHRRKDDMPLVYEKLVEDGLIARGDRRGEYYRLAGRQALAKWVPPARRRAA